MFRCSICLDADEAFGVLRCGHVFGIDCVTQHFEFRRDCPKCRTLAGPEDIRRIFLDGSEPSCPEPYSPHKSLKDMNHHISVIETVMERSENLDAGSSVTEISGLVQAAERAVVQVDDMQAQYGNILGQLNHVLGSLRNRLKYATHLRATRQELAKALETVDCRNEEIESHVREKAQLACETEAAAQDSIRLAKRNQQWLEKYDRLKKRFHAMERHHGALHKDHEKRLSDVKRLVNERDRKLVHYKKRLIAQRQEFSRTLVRARSAWDSGHDLGVVTGMPGGFPSIREAAVSSATAYSELIDEDDISSVDEAMDDYVTSQRQIVECDTIDKLPTTPTKIRTQDSSHPSGSPKSITIGGNRGWLKGCLNLALGMQRR